MREFDILFAKVSAERVWTWSKDDEIVEIFKQWDWYGGTLRVRDDQDFDLDKIRKNENSEWQDFEFQEGEDWYEYEYQVVSSDDSHEEILESEDDFDEGFEALCAKLKEDGYTLQKEELVVEKGPLAELSEN